MSPIKILVAARIEEAIAKGIGPGSHLIARMLGSKIDGDDESYHAFAGGQLFVKADEFNKSASVCSRSPGMTKVFEQNMDGKVELFIPGDWEEGFRYLLNQAVQDHRAAAKKESTMAAKKKVESDQRLAARWKM